MFAIFKKAQTTKAAPQAAASIPAHHTHKAVDNYTGLTLMTGTHDTCVAYVRAFGVSHVRALA